MPLTNQVASGWLTYNRSNIHRVLQQSPYLLAGHGHVSMCTSTVGSSASLNTVTGSSSVAWLIHVCDIARMRSIAFVDVSMPIAIVPASAGRNGSGETKVSCATCPARDKMEANMKSKAHAILLRLLRVILTSYTCGSYHSNVPLPAKVYSRKHLFQIMHVWSLYAMLYKWLRNSSIGQGILERWIFPQFWNLV
jgi:hypothetical protein